MQHIIITFLFILFAGTSLFAQDNAKYIGVWRAGNGSGQVLKTGPNAEGTQNAAGFTDIQQYASRFDGHQLIHYGVFSNKGTKNNVVIVFDSDVDALLKKNLKYPGGLYIHSLELNTLSSHKVTRFHAILKPGKKKQAFSYDLNWSNFVDDWKTRTKNGMRLREIIIDQSSYGGVRYHGLYEPGTGGHYLYSLTGWKAFTDKWAELGKKNYRLVDVETYRVGSKIQYIGVWAPGKDKYALYQANGYFEFHKVFAEMQKKGLVLIDLDIIN